VAPYVELEGALGDAARAAGVERYQAWVLPQSLEKARRQFAELPAVVGVFAEAFGAFPFPESKLAFVETSFWGMEHSTAIAYGSSYPAWIAEHGGRDPYAFVNRWFDYILVHELAHEWWGNSVTADDWGSFAVHEGFGTYAEGVFVERTRGREEADAFFREQSRRLGPRARVWREARADAGLAYSDDAYTKGALVLNTLRWCLDDDADWWDALRGFHERYRHGNASLDDFRAVLEERTGADWSRFFDEYVRGSGYPRVTGTVTAGRREVRVRVANEGSAGTGFHLPLDLAWTEDGTPRAVRLEVPPGGLELDVPCAARPRELAVVHLDRVLGRHDVEVR
jgi:aminopeptidase N